MSAPFFWGTSLMRTESTWFLDPLLGKPIVLPVCRSHWRNYIVLGSEGFFFSLSFVQRNSHIRCRYVALVPVVPADTRPAISFVLFHYSQYLPLLHSDGPFTGTCMTETCNMENIHYILNTSIGGRTSPSNNIPGKLYMAVHFPMGAAISSSSKSSSNSA